MVVGSRKPVQHGTRTGYDYHKCRCDECRAAAVAYQREHPSAHIPKGLTKAEALVLLDMYDESLDSIAATFDVSREAILELVRSRTYLGASFRRSPAPLRDRIFAVEDAVYLPDESSVVGVGKKPKEEHAPDRSVDIPHPPTPFIAPRPVVPVEALPPAQRYIGQESYVERSISYIARMIGKPRKFTCEWSLRCHDCGSACSHGWCRELDNGVGVPHTFLVYCPPCSTGWENTVIYAAPLTLLNDGDRNEGYRWKDY